MKLFAHFARTRDTTIHNNAGGLALAQFCWISIYNFPSIRQDLTCCELHTLLSRISHLTSLVYASTPLSISYDNEWEKNFTGNYDYYYCTESDPSEPSPKVISLAINSGKNFLLFSFSDGAKFSNRQSQIPTKRKRDEPKRPKNINHHYYYRQLKHKQHRKEWKRLGSALIVNWAVNLNVSREFPSEKILWCYEL